MLIATGLLAGAPLSALSQAGPVEAPVTQAAVSETVGRGVEPLPISAGDVLAVKAGAWNLVEGRYEEWTGVAGEVPVRPDGTIDLPMAGAVPAAGREAAAIAEEVAAKLQVATGLASPPAVTVEIARRPPIYVGGDVAAPGSFDYREGLTVRQALSLAGGPLRVAPGDMTELAARQARLEESLLRSDLRIARLEAELAGSDTLEVPEGLADRPGLDEIVAVETRLLEGRQASLAAQKASIESLIDVLAETRGGLVQQIDLLGGQLDLAEEELARRESLLDRGLARAPDVAGAQMQYSNLQLRQVDMTGQLIGLEKDLSEARRSQDALVQNREVALLEELAQERDRRRDTELELAGVQASALGLTGSLSAPPRLEISIIAADERAPHPAAMESRLRPGDTLALAQVSE